MYLIIASVIEVRFTLALQRWRSFPFGLWLDCQRNIIVFWLWNQNPMFSLIFCSVCFQQLPWMLQMCPCCCHLKLWSPPWAAPVSATRRRRSFWRSSVTRREPTPGSWYFLVSSSTFCVCICLFLLIPLSVLLHPVFHQQCDKTCRLKVVVMMTEHYMSTPDWNTAAL